MSVMTTMAESVHANIFNVLQFTRLQAVREREREREYLLAVRQSDAYCGQQLCMYTY